MCVQFFVVFKQSAAYELRITDWSSAVCSSDLRQLLARARTLVVLLEMLPEEAGLQIVGRFPLRRHARRPQVAVVDALLRECVEIETVALGHRARRADRQRVGQRNVDHSAQPARRTIADLALRHSLETVAGPRRGDVHRTAEPRGGPGGVNASKSRRWP